MRNTQILQKVAKSFTRDGVEFFVSNPKEIKDSKGRYCLKFWLECDQENFCAWVVLHASIGKNGAEYPNIHVNYAGIILKYPREAFIRNVLGLFRREKFPFKSPAYKIAKPEDINFKK